jgi:creatinine amidohydrolase
MMRSLYDLTSTEVAALLEINPVAIVAFGSIEQHGPHLPCGTDTMAAELVARELAERSGALYVPFCPYGVTPIHAGHPGTVSLRRATFEALLRDLCLELVAMGVSRLLFVNWHELNTPSLNAVATDIQDEAGVRVYVAQACYVAQRLYAEEGGSLTHGGSIETLAVMAHDAALVKLESAGRGVRPPGAAATDEMRRSHEVYGFVTDVTEIAEEGWYGEPGWATPERAATFADRVADEIAERLHSIGALEGGDPIVRSGGED